MASIDFIVISQSDVVDYNKYSKLPLDRIELYQDLIYPRMVYYQGGFHSHLDLINGIKYGHLFNEVGNPKRRQLLNIWNLPGFSGIHLANYLLDFGVKTKVINNFDAEWDLFCEAYDQSDSPPLVGISTTFYLSYSELRRLIKLLRNHDPNMDIVIGGAFANSQIVNNNPSDFEKFMRKYEIDFILHGFNSENDLKDLILMQKNNGDSRTVHNLAYIEDKNFRSGAFHVTKSHWNPPVLGDTAFHWENLDLPFLNRTIQLRTSSGCPFSCAFCSYPVTAKGFFPMNVEQVEKSVDSALRIPGIDRIIFIDDTFNIPRKRFKELCRMFSCRDFEWFSFLRVQFLDEETAKIMKDSGCRAVYLGIESANDVVLKNMNKKATRAQFQHGLSLLHKYDITTMAAFVLGFPGETESTIQDNVNFIRDSGIDFYTLKEFYYMEHTPIYDQREDYSLTGMGNKWKHNTMDSESAYLHKISMFREIKESVFIDPDTSLWYLAYLYDKGYTMEHIKLIQTEINKLMLAQIDGDFDQNHPGFDCLKRAIERDEEICFKNN